MDQRSRSPAPRFPMPPPPPGLPTGQPAVGPMAPGPLFRPLFRPMFPPLVTRPMVAPELVVPPQAPQGTAPTAEALPAGKAEAPVPPAQANAKSDSSDGMGSLLLQNMANKQMEKIMRVGEGWNSTSKFWDTSVRWGMPLHRAVDITPWSIANGTAGIKWEDLRLGSYISEKDSIPLKSFPARNVLAGSSLQGFGICFLTFKTSRSHRSILHKSLRKY